MYATTPGGDEVKQNKPANEELERLISLQGSEAVKRKRCQDINFALFKISNAVNVTLNRDDLFKSIHLALSPILDTDNFYIALYSSSNDSLSFPYIVDSVDENYPPVIEVSKTASLTAEVIRSGNPLMITKAEILRQREESPFQIPGCKPSEIWLGVPLKTRGEIIGVMAVQHYTDPHCYDQTDLSVMVSVAEQVAIALDRKCKEEELLASEARFRRMVTTANEGILSLNADWQITYTNSHLDEMLGYNHGELLGKPLEDVLWEGDLVDFQKRKQDRKQGINSKFERKFRTKQGFELCTIVSATAIFNGNGEFGGSFGMITDITALKRTEEKLNQKLTELNQALDQVKTLKGILPICMSCKKIRDDQGYWEQVEVYVRDHTEAEFSHGICPSCINELYPDLASGLTKKK